MSKNKDNKPAAIKDMRSKPNPFAKNPLIEEPGDKVTQQVMPHGDIITRVDSNSKPDMTHRQYVTKGGDYGKEVLILKNPKNKN